MSAKKGDLNLLIPGADGWEVWTGSSATGFQQHSATEHMLALEVTGLPSGMLAMAIPIRQISAVPFRAQTDDLSLLGDLAVMQLEKNGTRPALDGGQLTDYFIYGTAPDETYLTAIVMNQPSEGQLPRKSPGAFDISPRCLPLPEGKVVIWRELGRWVFGIGKPGHALYFQCLSSDRLDVRAGNEIRLALTQLQIQGLLKQLPDGVVVWSHGSSSDARSEELEFLARGLEMPVVTSPRPVPTWPAPPSRLLPADVRAERLAVRGKRNRNIMVAAGLAIYAGIVAYFYLDLQKVKKSAATAQKAADEISGEANLLMAHQNKWRELDPVVETEFHPFEVLLACQQSLPNTKDNRYIRLKSASVVNQFREVEGDLKVFREVTLVGLADKVDQPQIPKFGANLRNNSSLKPYRWSTPEEIEDRRTGKMTFTYVGNATE